MTQTSYHAKAALMVIYLKAAALTALLVLFSFLGLQVDSNSLSMLLTLMTNNNKKSFKNIHKCLSSIINLCKRSYKPHSERLSETQTSTPPHTPDRRCRLTGL